MLYNLNEQIKVLYDEWKVYKVPLNNECLNDTHVDVYFQTG